MLTYLGVFLLSASALAFEIVLSRLFSITQFYHFAFMTVSLALLGAGASGTALTVFPALHRGNPARRLAGFALGTAWATLGSFALANWLPFDSFAIAWDRRQVVILVLMYLALAGPFFLSSLVVGGLLAARPADTARLYAANLAGSAVGCWLALGALAGWGGERAAWFCAWLAALAAVMLAGQGGRAANVATLAMLVLFSAGLAARPAWLDIRLSPYKSLSQALRYPGAARVWTRWNASSRVDLITSPGIRSFPGLSYAYLGSLPRQDGLTFDGDDLSPITLADADQAEFARYLPGALAFQLRPGANALVLEARGGQDVLAALANGARRVVAVEPNDIAVKAVRQATPLGADSRVQFVVQDTRSFIARRRGESFDVVQLSLAWPFRPVTSGAYSLGEDYNFTVEGFGDSLSQLKPGGLFVVTRWLQSPPSEPLRVFALAVTAAERAQLDPRQSLIALRGYNTVTILVKRGEFTADELSAAREFAESRKFDLVVAPGLRPEQANRFNVLGQDEFYRTFNELVASPDRRRFYAAYPFDVSPATDDRPFFGHYWKWAQTGQVWAQLGKTWQPFGGAGYLVLIVLLAFALGAALVLILLPLLVRSARFTFHVSRFTFHVMAYFALLGMGFLFIEIPLVQRLILFVGKPTYALATVLFGLLMFSGLGSLVSRRAPWRLALVALAVLAVVYPLALPGLLRLALGLPLALRVMIGVASLAPLGILMGLPFPKGIAWLERSTPALIPWAWGVNGAVSVVASVLAALVALSAGFTVVLVAGAVCYGLAGCLARAPRPRRGAQADHAANGLIACR